MINVKLMHHTPIYIGEYAGRMCVAGTEKCDPGNENQSIEYLLRLVQEGHESVIEHLVCTLSIHGISRALLQELARHRHLSLSVESTRWALRKTLEGGSIPLAIPEAIEEDPGLELMIYDYIKKFAKLDLPNDIKKYFIPEAWETNLVMTANLRQLRHMHAVRTAYNALQEFQDLMWLIRANLPSSYRQLLDVETLRGIE